MYSFHTHTAYTDGCMVPAELIRRSEVAGIAGLGFSDHCDFSNFQRVIAMELAACAAERRGAGYPVAAGVEVTHVRPAQIAEIVGLARNAGAEYVLVHGETPVEPTLEGTNRAAIEAGCDILAHPGFIAPADAELAASKGVLLEITARGGHSLANGHVARTALEARAGLIFGSDTHDPGDIHGPDRAREILSLAGLSETQAAEAIERSAEMMDRITAHLVKEPVA